MKYDVAYCKEFDDTLSIYEVRDLNFDENSDFDSDNVTFECPDRVCRVEKEGGVQLTTVNAKNRQYKKTPHFREVTFQHWEHCPYKSIDAKTTSAELGQSHSESSKETHFPSEYIPYRKKYKKKIKEENSEHNADFELSESDRGPSGTSRQGSKSGGTNRTSVLEHIVECYLSNYVDKKLLESQPLTIQAMTLNYWSYFKKVRFFKDREGLIYWGKVKAIKQYKSSVSIRFADWVDGHSVSLYVRPEVLDKYRKKRMFMEEVADFVGSQENNIYCFFYGVYPQLKEVSSNGNVFETLHAEVENIDHIMIKKVDEKLSEKISRKR